MSPILNSKYVSNMQKRINKTRYVKGLTLKSKVIQLVIKIHTILKLRIMNLFQGYENEFSDFQRSANWLL